MGARVVGKVFFRPKVWPGWGSVVLWWKSVVDPLLVAREGKSAGIVALLPSNFEEMLK